MSPKRESKRKRKKKEEESESEAESSQNVPKKKRPSLPQAAKDLMRQWLREHLTKPFPTDEEKMKLAIEGNITVLQVENWFINARRRYLAQMLAEAEVEEGAEALFFIYNACTKIIRQRQLRLEHKAYILGYPSPFS